MRGMTTMTSRWLWAAAMLGASASAMLVEGCSKVESCTQFDKGCLNGMSDNGKCRFDLLPNADGECVKPADATNGGGGVDTNPCGCPSGQLCRADLTCSDPCAAATLPPQLPTLPACRPATNQPAYDFAKAALSLCYQDCVHRADYCGETCDPAKYCTSAVAAAAATAICPGQSVECAITACEATRDTACAQTRCLAGVPNCTGIVCTNTCSTPAYNNDGECDDSDLANATSHECQWGSDCGDCGPRRGVPPAAKQLGDVCLDPVECGGNRNDVPSSTGWCLVPGSATPSSKAYARCLPDCSGGKACPSGFTCEGLMLTATGEDVQDPQGNKASACFPNACGG